MACEEGGYRGGFEILLFAKSDISLYHICAIMQVFEFSDMISSEQGRNAYHQPS